MKIASIHKANDDDHIGSRRRDSGYELPRPSTGSPPSVPAADPRHQRPTSQARPQPKK